MSSKFHIEQVPDDSGWDAFVEKSPQGTAFSLSSYLNAVGCATERLFVYKRQELKAGLVYVPTPSGKGCALDDLIIYNGLMFSENPDQKAAKARHERFEITEFLINELDSSMDQIEFALAPQFEDFRPFLWHNYHSDDDRDKFKVDLRYTSYLDISEFRDDIKEEEMLAFKRLEVLRQRNIREARKKGGFIERSDDIPFFIQSYAQLMSSQGQRPSHEKLDRMARLIRCLLQSGMAEFFITRNVEGDPLYATIFCFDSKRAYYLFGAGDLEAGERYKGTLGFWDGFKLLARERDISIVDMEGVNSPQRGWFKLSFGGSLSPYYEVLKMRSGDTSD